MTNYF